MTFTLNSIIRMVALLAVGLTILAVGISHLDPPNATRRFLQPATNVSINDYFLKISDRQPRWIDSETGKLTVIPVEADDVLEAASCSPWVDDSGKRQVVGRWSNRTWRGPKTVCHAFGLGRYSFPDGRLLNQVHCETVPVGPPCWFPGTQARVVFAAGDGQLYRFEFEPAEPSLALVETGEAEDQLPTPITWGCPMPGVGTVFIGDISWPTDPRMGGRLVASMRIQALDATGTRQYTRTRIWSLKLNVEGTQIIEAAPLIAADNPISIKDGDERSPVVANLPDGSLGLAYTRQVLGTGAWTVHLATLTTDAHHRLVPTPETRVRAFQRFSQPAPVTFSSDGRWINVLVNRAADTKDVVARFSTLNQTTSTDRSDHQIR